MNHDLDLKAQVKQILKVVQQLAPGRSVELRIPPFAAIQCVGGSTHRRGTPPNVVEMSAETLIKLINQPIEWSKLCQEGLISASGARSDISELMLGASKLIKNIDRNLNG
jgi:hypothetical protein